VPFEVSLDVIEDIQRTIPELPDKKRTRFFEKYKLSEKDIFTLTAEKECIDEKGINYMEKKVMHMISMGR
jgi:aspartyl-tRNA(Asn)/glutamyl-tRNA(Gln) amidotransferase subunit B